MGTAVVPVSEVQSFGNVPSYILDHVEKFIEQVGVDEVFLLTDLWEYLYEIYGGPAATELRHLGTITMENAIEYEFGEAPFDIYGDKVEIVYWFDPAIHATVYKRVN